MPSHAVEVPAKPSAPRQILVLGMHRSGTSAATRLLSDLGAWVGDPNELLPAHPTDNPNGYWERDEVVTAHDQLLLAAGHRWDRVADFDPLSISSELRREFEERVAPIINKLDDRGSHWTIKDPRLCLTLPLWTPLLRKPLYIFVVRDLAEIVASLMASNARGVFTSSFLLALSEKYLRSALANLRNEEVLFVSYEALVKAPVEQASRLNAYLQSAGVQDLEELGNSAIKALIDPLLKRSVASRHAALSYSQTALNEWLLQQTAAPTAVIVSADIPASSADEILREYEAASAYNESVGRNAAAEASAVQIVELGIQISRYKETIAGQQHFEQLHAQALDTIAEGVRRDARRGQELQLSRMHSENLIKQLETLGERARQLGETIVALQSSLSWTTTAPLRWATKHLKISPNIRLEQTLYRMYYSIPGFSNSSKRAFILGLHRRLPWLTQNTLSFEINTRTQKLMQQRTADRQERERLQRINDDSAAIAIDSLTNKPLISIVMPVYNSKYSWLMAAVESVRTQFYPHWELCIADDASPSLETRNTLKEIANLKDSRIKIQHLPDNVGIALASNAALAMASGTHIGLLDHDDVLTRDALLEMALAIDSEDPDLIYSDEDKLDEDGNHVEPFFKPDFSPDYLFSNNYICHFSVFRSEVLRDAGGFRPGYDGAQDFDLMLRIAERTDKIAHIPKVLYHWRRVEGSTAATSSAKPTTSLMGKKALESSLSQRGIEATVEMGPYPNTFRVRRHIEGTPLVSVLVPFRDKPELLETCVMSVIRKTSYQNFEVVCVDNGSIEPATKALREKLSQTEKRIRFIDYDAPFNYSAINNFAAKQTSGEFLLLLNNDTEVISEDWMSAMLEHAQRKEVGVVGAQLWYPDRTIQHAGVIIGLGGVAGHSHLMLPEGHPGYFARPRLTQNVSAVTFACAMTRRDVFNELNGLNEIDLTVAFNDVDYCLRARELGYLIVYTPHSLLFHHESKSRGSDVSPDRRSRFVAEVNYMQSRHAEILKRGDPYYNPNLSLTENFSPDFSYADALPL